MKPTEIINIVGNTPHTSHQQGETLYNFVLEHRLTRCLEMGFAHGVATVWIAAALQELGGGKIISIDNGSAHNRKPSAAELVSKAGLEQYVELHYDESSYNWHIHNNYEKYVSDKFDLIFLDGAHNWEVDALAFFLGDRILKQDGWFLFDDIYWAYADSAALKDLDWVKAMSPLMRETQQVRSIWEKLVLTDPNYGNFLDDGMRGWAQKVGDGSVGKTLEVRRQGGSTADRVIRRLRKLLR
jgi:predicted O-methyltransferase YrrM